MPAFDPAPLRSQFPALAARQDGRPVVFLDGPGGTQVPRRVIDAVADYYRHANANTHGAFATSVRSDAILEEAHAAVADLLGAASPAEVKLGQNMTSLAFALSRSIARVLRPGDEVVISRLDHEANRAPWIAAAADAGAVVGEIAVDPATCTLDLDSLDAILSERTRLVAVGWASNAVGTVNPVAEIVRRAHAVGAWTFVDAVHYAPHGPLDVAGLGTDFLACSAYKFFGPHVGILWGRSELLDALPAYKVRPASDRWETGTQNHEGIAGLLAAVDYLADVDGAGGGAAGSSRRARLVAGMRAIEAYERELSTRVLTGLAAIPGLTVHGLADPARVPERTPTFAVTLAGWTPRGLAEALAAAGIYAWDGDFYATTLIEDLGLAASGGVVRLGMVHYTTFDEVDRLLATLGELASRPGS
ncbi:MAG TPA: cysteine desulfurase-like protein [Candidatus Nanopelagicales bacterium]|nr:cysteine desulfurase-like protein [Candidatus Nanopelagicales bacterium]